MNIYPGSFYFISQKFFTDFPDPHLVKNKRAIDNQPHNRPCCCAFYDVSNNLYWMVPISSQVDKYTAIYKHKIAKNGRCDTFVFGNVLGYRKAFLIQNMFPVTPRYILNRYVDKNYGTPISIPKELKKELAQKSIKILTLYRQGKRWLIFPHVQYLEECLCQQVVYEHINECEMSV